MYQKHIIIDEVEEKSTVETADVLRLKLEFESEERGLTREEAQRVREVAEAEAQRASDAEKALQDAQFVEGQRAYKEAKDLRLADLNKLTYCVK